MNIVIIGRGEVLYKVMTTLYAHGHSIPLIITAKESPEFKKGSSDFRLFAKKIGAKFIHSPNISANEIKVALGESIELDIGVSINYTGILEEDIILLLKLGILNMHTGDLPQYRGNAPIAWAILNNEDKIVNTIHWMESGVLDSGDILIQENFNLDLNTKICDVFDWVERSAPNMFLETLKILQNNPSYLLKKQRDSQKSALRCYPRLPEDCKIVWTKTCLEIHNLIRVSSKPFSGAFCNFKNDVIRIIDSEIMEDNEAFLAVPGQIMAFEKESVVVATGEGKLLVKKIIHNKQTLNPRNVITSLRSRFT